MNKLITPQILKGFRDFLPEDAQKRQYVIDVIRRTFELYGFVPIETPAIEYLETFTGNIGEDEHLFYKFKDQGGRDVALRYDQTVPTCRVIAQYPSKITLPFKRYQIQTVWRAEKPQKGRYREFLQCDADIFGVEDASADGETIALSIDIYKNLRFKKPIAIINDRELYKDIPYKAITAIDKLEKVGASGVLQELNQKGFSNKDAKTLLDTIKNNKPNDRLKKIFDYLDGYGLTENYQYKPTLARSFSYSTGPIWEIVVGDFPTGSLLGGERFDSLVSRFSNMKVPGTGFAIGFDRTILAMEELGLFPPISTKTKVLVTIFDETTLRYSQKIAQLLRSHAIPTDLFPDPNQKLEKQLKYALKKGVPLVLIAGPDELRKQSVTVKNLATRTQKTVQLKELPHALNLT
ncbi:histidine--tRNA ligase [Candidatus Gottesmanbacteria bacterium]|nr:histidine--tRNA ligase [Candidatus Gottesmanbacteria bacterium]